MPSPLKPAIVALMPLALLVAMVVGLRLLGKVAGPDSVGDSAAAAVPSGAPMSLVQDGTQRMLEKVIDSQTTSIRRNDYQSALKYAMPGFRTAVTPKKFSNIITANYHALTSYKSIAFAHAIGNSQHALMPINVIASDHQVKHFVFGLTNTDRGWRISSCMPEPILQRWMATAGPTHIVQYPVRETR